MRVQLDARANAALTAVAPTHRNHLDETLRPSRNYRGVPDGGRDAGCMSGVAARFGWVVLKADAPKARLPQAEAMTNLNCPACGHTFTPDASAPLMAPAPSVVHWFRVDPGWLGAVSTDEVYASYLRATNDPPVSRERFVADLAYLGIEEELDDDTLMLVRP
jgi:hypothetical protein